MYNRDNKQWTVRYTIRWEVSNECWKFAKRTQSVPCQWQQEFIYCYSVFEGYNYIDMNWNSMPYFFLFLCMISAVIIFKVAIRESECMFS